MKKATNIQILLVFILGLNALNLSAQQPVRINYNTSPPPDMPPATVLSINDRKELMATVEATMNDYAAVASMLDPSNRRITRESMRSFKEMFVSSAEVVHDFLEYIPVELVGIETYIDDAFNRLERNGINTKLGKVDLLKIEDDISGYYVVYLRVEKFSYNYVNEQNEVLKSDGGRYMEQEFIFDVRKGDLTKARIKKIRRICRGNECKTAADYVRYVGPSFSVFGSLVMPTAIDFNNENASDINVIGDFSYTGGIDFATSRFSKSTSTNKKFFTSIGVHFRYSRLLTELDGFSLLPFQATAMDEQGGSQSYTRLVDSIFVKERTEIGTITVPIGIGLKLSDVNKRHDFIIWASVIPGYNLFGTSKFIDDEAWGRHDALINSANWRALETKAINDSDINKSKGYAPFIIGDPLPYEGSPKDLKLQDFSLMAQLSPSFYFHLTENNPTWSFLLGLDLNYNFGSFLAHDETVDFDILRFPNDTEKSILQHYHKGMTAFSVGLRVGLLHRLTSKP